MKKSLVLIIAALLSHSAEAFQAPNPVVGSTATKLDAAISPRSTPIGVPTTKELKVKRGEMVLDPYYGIPNGILLGAPAILALYSCKNQSTSKPLIAFCKSAIFLTLKECIALLVYVTQLTFRQMVQLLPLRSLELPFILFWVTTCTSKRIGFVASLIRRLSNSRTLKETN